MVLDRLGSNVKVDKKLYLLQVEGKYSVGLGVNLFLTVFQ